MAIVTAQTLTNYAGSIFACSCGTCRELTVVRSNLIVFAWTIEEASPPHGAAPSRCEHHSALQCYIVPGTGTTSCDC